MEVIKEAQLKAVHKGFIGLMIAVFLAQSMVWPQKKTCLARVHVLLAMTHQMTHWAVINETILLGKFF